MSARKKKPEVDSHEVIARALADYDDGLASYVAVNDAMKSVGPMLSHEELEHFRSGIRELHRAVASLAVEDEIDTDGVFGDEAREAIARAVSELWFVENALGTNSGQIQQARERRHRQNREAANAQE